MNETTDEVLLHGRWIHSDDEDSDDRLVFRTADYPFPPRRMPRDSLTIEAGGAAETGSPGPVDRNVTAPETWSLKEDQLTISGSTRLSGRFQVVVVDEHMLVLRRCS